MINIVQKEYVGNIIRGANMYINSKNINHVIGLIKSSDVTEEEILITPYLINKDPIQIYELHYYEFEIDMKGEISYHINYPSRNCLEKEIIDNIHPRTVVARGDKEQFLEEISKYFRVMEQMTFSSAIEAYPILSESKLYYEFF
jgi:hypothetical protein